MNFEAICGKIEASLRQAKGQNMIYKLEIRTIVPEGVGNTSTRNFTKLELAREYCYKHHSHPYAPRTIIYRPNQDPESGFTFTALTSDNIALVMYCKAVTREGNQQVITGFGRQLVEIYEEN